MPPEIFIMFYILFADYQWGLIP